jgi:hypothetical protein
MGLLKKIGRTVKKTVRKVVPKEVAGIMTAAAPFVAPYSLPAAAALSIGGQLRTGQGRINPIVTGMSLLPGIKFQGGQGLGAFKPTGFTRFGPQDFGGGISARQLFFGGPGVGESGKLGSFGDKAEGFLFGSPEARAFDREAGEFVLERGAKQGLLGFGGEFGTGGSLISTMKDGAPVISKTKVAAAAAAGLSLTQTQAQIEEEADEAGLSSGELARLQQEAAEMWEDFDTTAFRPKITAAIGGLMRKNLREGSEGNELPPDPTKPIGVPPGFKPKPIGPVLPNKAEASPMSILNDMAIQLFGKPLDELDDRQKEMIMSFMKPKAQQGGLMRANYALGTMPTKEESGLGGLPIEADMRYTGGFMPYGAKEKADDVPARLSKNEFVFTADAVRAAGGGSVQKGAQKMYNSMKQLEAMGKMA